MFLEVAALAGVRLTRKATLWWTAAFLVMLMALAPASVMDWSVRAASSGRLGVAAPAGSFWSGSGYLTALGGASADMPIRWRVLLYRLFLGQLRIALAQSGAAQGTVTLSPFGMTLHSLDLGIPVSVIAPTFGHLVQGRLGGDARLRAEAFAMSRGESSGRMQLTVSNLSSRLVATRPLGSYEFLALGAERAARVEAKTVSGPLNVVGTGTWSWPD